MAQSQDSRPKLDILSSNLHFQTDHDSSTRRAHLHQAATRHQSSTSTEDLLATSLKKSHMLSLRYTVHRTAASPDASHNRETCSTGTASAPRPEPLRRAEDSASSLWARSGICVSHARLRTHHPCFHLRCSHLPRFPHSPPRHPTGLPQSRHARHARNTTSRPARPGRRRRGRFPGWASSFLLRPTSDRIRMAGWDRWTRRGPLRGRGSR